MVSIQRNTFTPVSFSVHFIASTKYYFVLFDLRKLSSRTFVADLQDSSLESFRGPRPLPPSLRLLQSLVQQLGLQLPPRPGDAGSGRRRPGAPHGGAAVLYPGRRRGQQAWKT